VITYTELTSESIPRLAPGVRFEADRLTGAPILLCPEGVVLINPTGAQILRLCDGRTSLSDIVAELASQYATTSEVLRADVAEYLGRLRLQRVIDFDTHAEAPS
jgi:pyrroloquinoline quinone biosynthesis protein D